MSLQLSAFGSNGSGQLGLGHQEDVSIPTPCQMPSGTGIDQPPETPIKDIKAGGNHTLLLTQAGKVYAAGNFENGRAGLTSELSSTLGWHPVRFSSRDAGLVDRFSLVAATWESSTFIDLGRTRVFTCGIGNRGQLGQGIDITQSLEPRLLCNFPPAGIHAVSIASCMSHTVVVLSNGEIWGWGDGRKGQLGIPAENVWEPRKIEVSFNAVEAACGREFTFVVTSPDEPLYVIFGSNKWDVQSAAPVSVQNWKQIEASWSSLYVLLRDGHVISWGRNDRDQLAPEDTPMLEQIAAGSEHAVARARDGWVVAWGWGEHGNCGQCAVEGHVNTVAKDEKVSFVGAGCATTFIAM